MAVFKVVHAQTLTWFAVLILLRQHFSTEGVLSIC